MESEGPWSTDMGENDPEEELRLILIGKTGSGKSASGNTILGGNHFLSKFSAGSVTKVCQLGTSDYPVEEEAGRRSRRKKVVVLDMPGFGDTHLTHEQIITEISQCMMLTAPGPHAFLLVVPLGRYTEEENMAVTKMAAVFGDAALRNHTVVLFTRGDDLEEPMEEYLASAPASFKALIDRCGGRYHVLNNRAPSDVQQVHELLGKVEQVVDDNGGGCYTNAMYLKVEEAIREKQDRIRRKKECRLRRKRAPAEEGFNRRPQSPPSSSTGRRSEALLSPSLMQRVMKMVAAAGFTGLAVGAVCGALIPVAAGLGAYCVGSTLAISAAQIGMGAALGGVLGGIAGVVVGLDADSPYEGAQKTLLLVGSVGVGVVGVAAVGGALGGLVGGPAASGALTGVGAAGTVLGILATIKVKGNIKTGEFQFN